MTAQSHLAAHVQQAFLLGRAADPWICRTGRNTLPNSLPIAESSIRSSKPWCPSHPGRRSASSRFWSFASTAPSSIVWPGRSNPRCSWKPGCCTACRPPSSSLQWIAMRKVAPTPSICPHTRKPVRPTRMDTSAFCRRATSQVGW